MTQTTQPPGGVMFEPSSDVTVETPGHGGPQEDTYVNPTFEEVELNNDSSRYTGANDGHVEDADKDDREAAVAQDPDVKSDTTHAQPPPVPFKQKLLISVCIYCNVLTIGMVYGQIGPALPDLQTITGSSLQQVTWLFTGFGIGYMAGCLLIGIVQARVSSMLLLVGYTTGTALCCGILPWMNIIYVSIAILAIQGVAIAGQFTVGIAMLFGIWREAIGPYHQVIYFVYAAGGFISPLYTRPFFREQTDLEEKNGHDMPTYNASNTSSNGTSPTDALSLESRVQYAFLISSLLSLSAAIPFLIMYIFKVRYNELTYEGIGELKDKGSVPKRCVIIVLGLFVMTAFIAPASTDVFPYLLTTFVIQQLDWTQQSGSDLTSIFYIAYGVGSLLGILILKYSTTTKLIVLSYFCAIAGLVACAIGAVFDTSMVIWVAMGTVGAGMSSLTPSMCTWVEENVTPVSGRITSVMLLSEGIGLMLQPLLLGYLMDNRSPMWFLNITLGCMCVGALCFIMSFILVKRYSHKGD